MAIVIENLHLSFEDKPVLANFSLQIPDQGVVCIIGPSGSGKTTLFNCLAGIIKPDSGSIRGLEGKRISMVFQDNRLLPWYDALDNVAFVLRGDKKMAAEFLAQMELADAMHKYPCELSGGMQKRVAIARALAYGGDILMMDEPTAGLDHELSARIMEKIVVAWQDKLVLLITHDPWLAERFAQERYFVHRTQD